MSTNLHRLFTADGTVVADLPCEQPLVVGQTLALMALEAPVRWGIYKPGIYVVEEPIERLFAQWSANRLDESNVTKVLVTLMGATAMLADATAANHALDTWEHTPPAIFSETPPTSVTPSGS